MRKAQSIAARKEQHWAWLMVAPTIIGLLILNYYPLIETFILSFSKTKTFGASTFNGINNYIQMFQSPEFWKATWNTILFCILTVPVGIILALLVALLLNAKVKFKGGFRAIYFLPMVCAPAAIAMVWRWMFNGEYGIINQILGTKISWLTDPKTAIVACAIVAIWSSIGYDAVLLLSGTVAFGWEGRTETVSRRDVFTDGPYALHVCTGEEITVEAQTDAEILVQCTKNDTAFSGRLYRPEDAPWVYSCVGKFGNVAKRRVNTIFDKDIAPWSNMVLGEVLNDRGNWSGYLPHRHPQPECYYFKFDRPEGFGASFVGDQVFKSVDNSFSAIPGGIPGTPNLAENKTVTDTCVSFAKAGKKVAAICAAPSVLASLGLLEGKNATAHAGFQDKLAGAIVHDEEVVVDGNITTSYGLGGAIPFALELVRQLAGPAEADRIQKAIAYRH